MTIDSSWIACFKEEAPAAFRPSPPFSPTAVFCDGQIKLMPAAMEGVVSWEDYIQRQFARHIGKYFSKGVSCVILAFDDYNHVPQAKSMTQIKRRRHLPPVEFNPRDALPPCVPQGERWQQCISNRTFKSKVIQLVIRQLTGSLLDLGEGQSLIVDYQGHPVQYLRGGESMELTGFAPLGEADVKFARYSDMFDKLQVIFYYFLFCTCISLASPKCFFILQVDSVDGDSIPIALLHLERGGSGRISILRLKTNLKEDREEQASAKKLKLESAPPLDADPLPKKSARCYEYVDANLLFESLRCMVIPQCTGRAPVTSHAGHEIAMLVCLIGLSGTDFTRGLPLVSGKTLHDYLSILWMRLAKCYDPATRQMVPELALNLVVSAIYHTKFERHSGPLGPLDGILDCIRGSEKLSIKTRDRLPTRETLHCTVRNVNWLLRYWQEAEYPDPVQPEFGFARDKKGAVRFAE